MKSQPKNRENSLFLANKIQNSSAFATAVDHNILESLQKNKLHGHLYYKPRLLLD